MFGQKKRERREMYISEHVVHIRQQLTTVGRAHKSMFFLSLSFFDNDDVCALARAQSIHTKQCTKGQASGQSVRSFIRIVVLNGYCRLLPPKFVLLCLRFFSITSGTPVVKSTPFPKCLHGELVLCSVVRMLCARTLLFSWRRAL
jgi:hypothetical protein